MLSREAIERRLRLGLCIGLVGVGGELELDEACGGDGLEDDACGRVWLGPVAEEVAGGWGRFRPLMRVVCDLGFDAPDGVLDVAVGRGKRWRGIVLRGQARMERGLSKADEGMRRSVEPG